MSFEFFGVNFILTKSKIFVNFKILQEKVLNLDKKYLFLLSPKSKISKFDYQLR